MHQFLAFSTLFAASSQPVAPPKHVFIGGLGYCGARVAAALHTAYPNCQISGTVRSTERRDAILSSPPPWLTGSVHVLDLDDAYSGLLGGSDSDGIADLMAATHIIQTVAPIADFDRDPLLALHGNELASSTELQYVAYISSTGVYGDHGGEWVTEESALGCVDAKSKARILAEKEWSSFVENPDSDNGGGGRVDCFRCGGIYGPGRGPLFSSISSLNEAMENEDVGITTASQGSEENDPPIKYVNRILVDDICGAILAGIAGNRPRYKGGRAYNLVDDDPAPRRVVVAEARRLLAPKSLTSSNESSNSSGVSKAATRNTRRRVSRATGNKRCDNSRLKIDYGWILKAPTYREGLAVLLENSEI